MRNVLNMLATTYAVEGDLDRALQHYEESLRIGERVGDLWGTTKPLISMGGIHLMKGDGDRALATSANTVSVVRYGRAVRGHIMDPATGWPAEGWSQVSVVARTGLEADALSTAMLIDGRPRPGAETYFALSAGLESRVSPLTLSATRARSRSSVRCLASQSSELIPPYEMANESFTGNSSSNR